MSRDSGLLDTSVFVGLETQRKVRMELLPAAQFVSAVTLGELFAGVHAATETDTRAARMRTVEIVSLATVLDVDADVAAIWARLRQRLRESGRRINVNDLWIASTALAHSLPVVTQDADFEVLSDLGGPEIITV